MKLSLALGLALLSSTPTQSPDDPLYDDLSAASEAYANAVLPAEERAGMFQQRVAGAEARVVRLTEEIQAHQAQLDELEVIELERFVTLRAHFEGAELEARMEEERADLEVRRVSIEDQLEMALNDRADAESRLRDLRIQLRMALIEAQTARAANPVTQTAETPIVDELEREARSLLQQRALAVGDFSFVPVPRVWMHTSP